MPKLRQRSKVEGEVEGDRLWGLEVKAGSIGSKEELERTNEIDGFRGCRAKKMED